MAHTDGEVTCLFKFICEPCLKAVGVVVVAVAALVVVELRAGLEPVGEVLLEVFLHRLRHRDRRLLRLLLLQTFEQVRHGEIDWNTDR